MRHLFDLHQALSVVIKRRERASAGAAGATAVPGVTPVVVAAVPGWNPTRGTVTAAGATTARGGTDARAEPPSQLPPSAHEAAANPAEARRETALVEAIQVKVLLQLG